VSSQSATLLGKRRLFLNTDHSGLNKFSGEDDENFVRLLPEIRRMINDAPLIIDRADAWILDKCYTIDRLKIERLSGDQLSMDQCYINLAIVEHSGHDAAHSEGSKTDPFSLLARLKIETPDKDIQIELKTLFNPRKGPDGHTIQPRRIFIRGRAGVGKTTLCKKMVHDFKSDKRREDRKNPIWNDLFDRILWIPLRTLKTKPDKGYNLEGLFLRDFFSNTSNREDLAKELERSLDASEFSRTLFILDGLDEVSEGLGKDNEMHRFLKFLLDQPNVIITSRPLARFSYNLHPDLELETIGFYPDQVNTYIDKAFTDPATAKIDPKASEIQLFLKDHWLIQGLVRIPIQLDALCYTWNKSSFSKAALETMTAMYQAIEHRLWKKDTLRLEKTYDGKLLTESFIQEASWVKVEGFVKDEISFLECLAFAGLHNNIIDFGIEHRNAIADHLETSLLLDRTLPCLSFLRRSNPSAEDYHFLHLTYQEYFAARYFVQQWTSRQDLEWPELKTQETRRGIPVYSRNTVSYLHEHKYNPRYNVFWRFVAGLLDAEEGNETLHFFRTIEDEPRDLLGPVHQRLVMHCLGEIAPSRETSEFSQLRKYLEDQLKQWLLFECIFEFNHTERSQLAAEMEFPEKILKDILQKESEDMKEKILNSLTARPRLSPAIIKLVTSYLGNDVSIRLKRAALSIFYHHYKALPEEIVQAIAALLKDPEEHIRSAAVEALSRQSALPEEIIQAVMALLKDPQWYIRSAVAAALSRQSALSEEIMQAVAALLKDPDEDIRSDAVEILRRQLALPEEIIQTVAALLKDPQWYFRSAAVRALSWQSALPEEIIQAVMALLKDPHEDVRSAAVEVLNEQSALPEQIIQAVVALLKDPDNYIRSAAVRALSEQSALPEEIIQAVAALLKDPDNYIRLATVRALSRQSALPEEIIQAVVALLKDPDKYIRSAALEVLRRQSALPEQIIQAVAALLKDPDNYVRLVAVLVLSRQSALLEQIIQAVAALLKDPDNYIRSATVVALSEQSALPEEIIQAIAALLKDPQWYIRSHAVEALSRQSALPEEIIQAVAALLKDPHKDVRSAAVRVLNEQSALPEEIIQAVVALLKDPKEHIRSAAVEILSRQSALPDRRAYYILLKLNSELFNNLYRNLLGRSFSDYLTWYIKGDKYSINLPEGGRDIPFNQLQQNAVQKAQASLKVPTLQQT
jgi:HEAT repeat protein